MFMHRRMHMYVYTVSMIVHTHMSTCTRAHSCVYVQAWRYVYTYIRKHVGVWICSCMYPGRPSSYRATRIDHGVYSLTPLLSVSNEMSPNSLRLLNTLLDQQLVELFVLDYATGSGLWGFRDLLLSPVPSLLPVCHWDVNPQGCFTCCLWPTMMDSHPLEL